MIAARSALVASAFVVALGAVTGTASAQFRVVSYNVANLVGSDPDLETVFAALRDDPDLDTGVIRAPDVYVFQEVGSTDTSVLRTMLNDTAPDGILYNQATFTVQGGGGENALFFRSDTVSENRNGHRDITNHTGPRATDRWQLELLGAPGTSVWVYGSHFKAGTDNSDEAARWSEAIAVRNDADSLGESAHILYCGDWNVYTGGENAFRHFFEPGNGTAVDPRFNRVFATVAHTQSPADGSIPALTTGGMDNRFDFQLCTTELDDGLGFDVIDDSYRAFGNDGLHFDRAINFGTNEYFPVDEQFKADALARASDHLPVVVDYRVPGIMRLTVDNVVEGEMAIFSVTDAPANTNVYFIYSLAGLGSTDVTQLGVTLRLAQPVLLGSTNSNGIGAATLFVTVPSNTSGLDLWTQAAISGDVTDVVYREVQ